MPKLRKTESEQKNVLLIGTIRKYLSMRGVTVSDLAITTRLGESTMYRRMRVPEELTLGELRAIMRKLQIPVDEIKTVI